MKRILAAIAAGLVLAAGVTAVSTPDAHAANGRHVAKANGLKANGLRANGLTMTIGG